VLNVLPIDPFYSFSSPLFVSQLCLERVGVHKHPFLVYSSLRCDPEGLIDGANGALGDVIPRSSTLFASSFFTPLWILLRTPP